MRIEFADIGGARTRIARGGSGSYPVLFIHGLGTQAERWMLNLDGLPEGFATIAPDLVNNGFSADADFSGEAPQRRHLRQIRELADHLEWSECAVVGSSYGGLIAALFALEYPGLVKRLVIVGSGSALHPPVKQKEVLQAVRKNAMGAIHAGTLDACRDRMAATTWNGRNVSEAMLPGLLTANALPGRLASAERFYDALIAHADDPACQSWPRLEQLTMPTLIVTGREDIRASWQKAAEARLRIPDCELSIFEECGHGPMAEYPERFNQALSSFLAPLTRNPWPSGARGI
ncbi:MAG: alpha/beta fold hydrolase [Paucimonas sp.]|nr:alpha/beta fold hydrolase [Paucimonas sp.]